MESLAHSNCHELLPLSLGYIRLELLEQYAKVYISSTNTIEDIKRLSLFGVSSNLRARRPSKVRI